MIQSDFVPASRPVLWDVRSCNEWLARAPLADSRQACAAFLSLLDQLEDAPPRHVAYLQILERLRGPIVIAQEENAKRFTFKPLPLGHVESVAFGQACELWLALLRAYGRLRRAAIRGRPELAGSVALLCERVIECTGELIDAHFLASREVGEDQWHWLHEAYALAERRGVADVAIADSRSRRSASSTCTAAYVRPLMLALVHPCGLRERELAWARQWTHRWAAKVRVGPPPRSERGYCVDLAGATGPLWDKGPEGQEGSSATDGGQAAVRHLDFADVGRSIKWRLKKLEEGAQPAELGLGRGCTQPVAGELLTMLHSCWTRAPKSRQFPRRVAHAAAELASGMARIHAALGGEVIVTHIRHWDYNRRDTEQIHNVRHAAAFETRHNRTGAEQWNSLDESAAGFRLRRYGPGERLAQRQLVALRPRGAQHFILCELRWLAQGTDRTLTVGVRALVGYAQPASVRPVSEDRTAPFSYALTIPVARDLPVSVVLPGGWHQPGRMLELRAEGQILRIRLTELLARGYDFDHARFEVVGP